MDKKIYKNLFNGWEKPIYQGVSNRKTKYILQYIHLLKNKNVVDLGSNAGVITYDIAQYAKEVLGVEYDPHFYRQSLDTLTKIKIPSKFINLNVGEFIKTTDFDYNAIFASCILYHLKTEEIDLIKEIMLPKCDIVLFVSREDKKNKTNNPYGLNKWKNIKSFLSESGMKIEVYNADSNWATVIGRNEK